MTTKNKKMTGRALLALMLLTGYFLCAAVMPAYAMTLNEAEDIIWKKGKEDINAVRAVDPVIADKVEEGMDAVHTWCQDGDAHQAACIAAAVALAI